MTDHRPLPPDPRPADRPFFLPSAPDPGPGRLPPESPRPVTQTPGTRRGILAATAVIAALLIAVPATAWTLETVRDARHIAAVAGSPTRFPTHLELPPSVSAVSLDTDTADITVRQDPAAAAPFVEVTSDGGAPWTTGHLAQDGSGDRIALTYDTPDHTWMPFGSARGAQLTLVVPEGTDLAIDSGYGDLSVDGVYGTVEITAHYGDVDATGSYHALALNTEFGDLRPAGLTVGETLTAATSMGEIEAELSGPDLPRTVDLSSAMGDVDLVLPRQDPPAIRVTTQTSLGDVHNTVPPLAAGTASTTDVHLSTEMGSITVTAR